MPAVHKIEAKERAEIKSTASCSAKHEQVGRLSDLVEQNVHALRESDVDQILAVHVAIDDTSDRQNDQALVGKLQAG